MAQRRETLLRATKVQVQADRRPPSSPMPPLTRPNACVLSINRSEPRGREVAFWQPAAHTAPPGYAWTTLHPGEGFEPKCLACGQIAKLWFQLCKVMG